MEKEKVKILEKKDKYSNIILIIISIFNVLVKFK